MVTINDAVVARCSKSGHHFEVYVDAKKAVDLKHGKDVPLHEVLAVQEVFKDAAKGERVTDGALQDGFGTTDHMEAARQIILHGEVQTTTEQRREIAAEKRNAVITIIARESYNPQTNTPHTPQRIERAMEEAHVSINPFKCADEQVDAVIKAIRPLLPISIARIKIEVLVPPEYTGKVYSALKARTLQKEEWLQDGHLKAVVELPAGLESELYDEINAMTHGEVQMTRLKKD